MITSQDKQNYPEAVMDFMKKVERYSKAKLQNGKLPVSFKEEDTETLLRSYYHAIATDYVKYMQFTKNKNILSKKNKEDVKFGYFIKLIKEQITAKYSERFLKIISYPNYIKGKIISKNEGPWIDPSNGAQYTEIIYSVLIEEVIKGRNLKEGDRVEISVINLGGIAEFGIEKSYFINLLPITDTIKKGAPKYTTTIFDDGNKGNYPIIDGKVYTPNNFFGIGELTDWKSFKQKFEESYIISSESSHE